MWIRMMTALRRWLGWVLPAAVLLIFAVTLNAGTYLKRPMGRHDDVPGALSHLEQAIMSERWTESGAAHATLSSAIAAVRRRIALASERSELQRFEETLGMLDGSLKARDKASALQHLALLKLLYKELGH